LPPAEPEAGVSTSTGVSTFAIDSVLLGDTDDGGSPTNSGWKVLGYDLDRVTTTISSTDVCTLQVGAARSNQADGIGGRDNAFGSVIVPIVQTARGPICIFDCPDAGPPIPSLSQSETAVIDNGGFTLQFSVAGLTDDPDQTALSLTADVFASDALGAVPAFDSSTDWPVLPESVAPDGGALAHFGGAYVVHGTFVAGLNDHVTVPLHTNIDGFLFTLPIHEAIITFDHVAPGEAANGVLGGVLDLAELTAIFRRFVGRADEVLCGSAFDGLADDIAFAADILPDRSNHAGTPCTAISFGMGFHATRIANPTKVAPPLAYPDPCDAGTD
jgi:hypothetical protein